MKALNNRIFLIKDDIICDRGNIYIPKSNELYAPPYSGTIINVGPNVKDPEYKEGIRITFHDIAGVELLLPNDKKIFSIREKDVTSIIDNNVSIE